MRYDARMKDEPPPKVPGKTPWERFDNAVRTVLAVPKETLLRKEAKLKKARHKKRARRKAVA
jgi:hypothetical protein